MAGFPRHVSNVVPPPGDRGEGGLPPYRKVCPLPAIWPVNPAGQACLRQTTAWIW